MHLFFLVPQHAPDYSGFFPGRIPYNLPRMKDQPLSFGPLPNRFCGHRMYSFSVQHFVTVGDM